MTLTDRINHPDRRAAALPVIAERRNGTERREPLIVRLAREGRFPVRVEMREYPRVAA